MKFLNQIDGASQVVTDSSHRFVTDAEKETWNNLSGASSEVAEIYRQEFTTTENQTLFTLTSGSYVTGKNRLSVYISGIKQPSTAFTETSQTSFTLNALLPTGTSVIAEWIEAILVPVEEVISAENIVQTEQKNFVSNLDKQNWNAKADGVHTHLMADITDLDLTQDVDWIDILNKPTTFTPSEHNHDTSYSPTTHNHDSTYAPLSHTNDTVAHVTSTDKSTWNGKAEAVHNHTKSEITDFPTSLPANGGTAGGLKGTDTRSIDSPPSEYMSTGSLYLDKVGFRTEFKSITTLGVGSFLTGTYCYLVTMNPWSDASGGYPIQTAYGAGIPCMRVGISATTWSGWKALADGGNAVTLQGMDSTAFATSGHTHSNYLPTTGGTMTGILYPQQNTSYTTGQARRIILSTADPSGGGNGDIWIKYTP